VTEFIGRYANPYPILRVGVYVHFVRLASDLKEANKQLTAVIPNEYRPRITDEEDFTLQINRPFPSRAVDGMRMNKITKWSADRFQVLSLSFQVSNLANVGSQLEKGYPAASVICDNNTVPVKSPLTNLQQMSLLQEALGGVEQVDHDLGLDVEGF